MNSKTYTVYILASGKRGTVYVGVTSKLFGRIREHKSGTIKGFTSRYAVTRLVYREFFDDPVSAITREKELKKMAARLEDQFDRTRQPQLGRLGA